MSFCLAELHLWSSRSTLLVRDTDIGTYQYYDKGEPVTPSEYHYFSEKQQFAETRGYSWIPGSHRPEKLRDSLKDLEELLQTSLCVRCRWKNKQCCQLFLSSGVLVTLSLNGPQLERVSIDRALVGRLAADTISDAEITDRFLLLVFVEKNTACLIHLHRKEPSRQVEKLSISDLKVSCADLPGPAGRRLARRLGLNHSQDVAVCWWPAVNEGAWPWSPVPGEGERANLVLLDCASPGGLKVLSCIRTGGDPLDCRFSLSQPYQVLTVELGEGEGEGAESCVYEYSRGLLQRLSAVALALAARPVSCCHHPTLSLLLLGLQDSSLVLYDAQRFTSRSVQTSMVPLLLDWHPAGAMVAVGGGQGELQCFDVGLSPMGLRLLAEEPAPAGPSLQLCGHLRAPGGLVGLQWTAPASGGDVPEVHDLLSLRFHGGPVALLRFRLGALTGGQLGMAEVVQQRLRCGEVQQAVDVLGTMDWSIMGVDCYRVLTAIVEHLLRQELNAEREAQLEAALGMFYAPSRPLSDTVVLEYRDAICKYARRFFHHLLRYQRFEKAFLLAVDIGARDLFMDIHYIAQDKRELVLADVAKKKANEIDTESITTGLDEPLSSPRGRKGGCNSNLSERQTNPQLGRKPPVPYSEVKSHTLTQTPSQESLALRTATGGKLAMVEQDIFSGVVTGGGTWGWAQAEINLGDSEHQVAGETGSLKVVHFGLV